MFKIYKRTQVSPSLNILKWLLCFPSFCPGNEILSSSAPVSSFKTSHAVKFNTTTYTIGNGVNKFTLHTQPIFISSPIGILVTYLDVYFCPVNINFCVITFSIHCYTYNIYYVYCTLRQLSLGLTHLYCCNTCTGAQI